MKPKIKVVGAEFERVIHAAPRSGTFLKPAHRSAPAIFDPLRSVFRSAHASLTCSARQSISSSLKIAAHRSFRYASPCLWNQLFLSLRTLHSSTSSSISDSPCYSFTHHFFHVWFTTVLIHNSLPFTPGLKLTRFSSRLLTIWKVYNAVVYSVKVITVLANIFN